MGTHETAITTTKGNRRLLDPEDYQRLQHYVWYEYPNGRAYRREGGRIYLLHREVMQVDHRNLRVIFANEDARDCRRQNLRVEKRHQRGRQRRIPPWRGSSRFRRRLAPLDASDVALRGHRMPGQGQQRKCCAGSE